MPNSIINKLVKEYNLSPSRAEHLWEKAKEIAENEGFSETSDSYYPYIVGVVKKMVNTDHNKKMNWDAQAGDKNAFLGLSYGLGFDAIDLAETDVKKTKQIKLPQVSKESIPIDASFWLPLAAKHYCISGNLNDYVLMPVPTIISEIPNTNGDSVSKEELLDFVPDLGMPAYRTFKGKACFLEHANTDIKQAKGVILDVFLKPLKGFAGGKHAKLIKLLGFDKSKDPMLCKRIEDGAINTVSMGMYYTSYSCSICGNSVGTSFGKICQHTKPRVRTYQDLSSGKLAYRKCKAIRGFETSIVADPAYVNAIGVVLSRD